VLDVTPVDDKVEFMILSINWMFPVEARYYELVAELLLAILSVMTLEESIS